MTTNKFNFLKDDFQEDRSGKPVEEIAPKTKPKELTEKPAKSSKKTPKTSNQKEIKKAEVKDDKTGKRNNPDYKVVGVLMPKKLHKKAKVLLMDDDEERDFSDLMTELLEGWLAQQDG
ncbi:MAG: hypothetical protein QNJ72_09210 [Pleurocapsa sp. MO_226.B13]|nr:hypothetical protein [Pleurocapsa sp. MO_226.B13]